MKRALESSAAQGTIANGATISLPTGFAQDQCKWIVSVGSVSALNPYGFYALVAVADANRVVSAYFQSCNWIGGGTCPYGAQGITANYIIVCSK
jgi:hypothetical protein